jgi:hypothetical protein
VKAGSGRYCNEGTLFHESKTLSCSPYSLGLFQRLYENFTYVIPVTDSFLK